MIYTGIIACGCKQVGNKRIDPISAPCVCPKIWTPRPHMTHSPCSKKSLCSTRKTSHSASAAPSLPPLSTASSSAEWISISYQPWKGRGHLHGPRQSRRLRDQPTPRAPPRCRGDTKTHDVHNMCGDLELDDGSPERGKSFSACHGRHQDNTVG